MPGPFLLTALARAFLAGEQTVDQVVLRATGMLGSPWRWLKPLAQRYLEAHTGQTRPRHRDVVRFLRRDKGFRRAQSKYFHELSIEHRLTEPQQMLPVAAAALWDLPAIETAGELAAWLGLDTGELEWFADLKGLAYKRKSPPLAHYHYKVLAKRSSVNLRLIESPKPRLKQLQRQILSLILNKIPCHGAVHGFVKGRSIKTFTAPHVGQRVVLRMDLQNFFPTISGARIQTFFRTLGYPESVADLLGGICSNATPRDIWNGFPNAPWEMRALYARPHLPQGAPVSPALANLCTYRVDCRLTGLAKSAGAEYTRYADDLAFSGGEDFERCAERFSTHAAVILHEEGFQVNHRKTRIMRQGVRQHLAGLVVNRHANVRRNDFDGLKAILTNCVRLGPTSQNRDAHPSYRSHLEGRVGFVESINPAKGKRLRAIFDRIAWSDAG
jgi:RNA-directed DNA polymerase